jgi:hypothetical protein
MKYSHIKIENLLNSLPDEREELLPYVAKVKQYSSECGCSLGGKFLLASLALCVARFLLVTPVGFPNLLKQFLLAILFIFFSSIAGKLIGIGLAKIQLAGLYRHLNAKYGLEGE